MYAWEGKHFDEIASLTLKRKPERYPVYCVVEGVQDGKTVRLTQHFRDLREMSAFLQRMEPRRWGLSGAAFIQIKAKLEDALTLLDVFGPTDQARQRHNQMTAPTYRIVNWGWEG